MNTKETDALGRNGKANSEKQERLQSSNKFIHRAREVEQSNIIDKCREQLKLFNRYMNKKLKRRESIIRLRDGGITYEEPKEIDRLPN